MNTTSRQEYKPNHFIANANQLHKEGVTVLAAYRGRKTRTLLKLLHAWRRDINGSWAAALGLGAALVLAFNTSTQAADAISQLPLKAPPPFALSPVLVGAIWANATVATVVAAAIMVIRNFCM